MKFSFSKKFHPASFLAMVFFIMTAGPCVANESAQDGKILAKINGEPIYEDQVTAVIQARFRKANFTADDNQQTTKLQLQALEEIIPSKLIYQAGQKLSIPDIDTKIDHLTQTFKNHPLGHYNGKTDEQLRELAKQQIYSGEYFEVNKLYSPTIPESDVIKYYEANKQSFATKEDRFHVRHIFVGYSDNNSPENKEQALEKITEARSLIVSGQDFAEIADKYSEDKKVDLGFINRGYMPAEFDAIAFASPIGKLSDVVATEHGYHVLEVTEIVPKGTIPSYENLKKFFTDFLVKQKSKIVIEEHILALREKAEIEFLLE